MDMRQGAERADRILDGTLKAIVPPVRWVHGTSISGLCSGSSTTGQVTRQRTVLTIISPERRGNFFGLVERHWKSSGYHITGNDPGKTFPSLYATAPGEYRMSLQIGDKGQAFFDVTTPCLDKASVPDPASDQEAPRLQDGEIPYPNHTSDFWSAKKPLPS
ncbi:hypothetical protein [Streptomyces huiliensis]|uniref:hypothetical protein n=1 Tax=Streptomyces huiliensis TaxID=2876027 RepID=UPI001CBAE1C1|nr:hypothetical protein [Streptomyces huiliensis]MBZ4323136.1 hypothetical protein [Streptomyces huiliensis]